MATGDVQSQVRTSDLAAGFEMLAAIDAARGDTERFAGRDRDARTGEIDWLGYCVRNHLI